MVIKAKGFIKGCNYRSVWRLYTALGTLLGMEW